MFSILVLAIIFAEIRGATVGSNVSINVINGDVAMPHLFPFAAFIRFGDKGQHCNGILISPSFVLTNAICASNGPLHENETYVDLGCQDIEFPEATQKTIKAKSFLTHPGYLGHIIDDVLPYNIALIELEEPVKFTDTIQAANISQSYDSFEGKIGRSCGWGGNTYDNGTNRTYHNVLLTFENEIIPLQTCKAKLKTAMDYSICVNDSKNQRLGSWDDGAPLIIDGALVGVGSQPPTSNTPSVFTRVSPFWDWIINHTDICP